MLCVPSTCCTDVNAIVEFVTNASESVFCHRLYGSRDCVCELTLFLEIVQTNDECFLPVVDQSRNVI
jgi:hypothetical protein